MDFNEYISQTTAIAGAIIAVGGAFAIIWKLGRGLHFQVVVPIVESLKGIWKSLEELERAIPIMRNIAYEFSPNAGGSLRDVVDRIENGLISEEHVTRVILNKSPEAHFETDAKGNCIWVNDAYSELSGLNHEDCLGQGWLSGIDIADRAAVIAEWNHSIKEGIIFEGVYRFTKTGFARCTTAMARNHKGELLSVIGTVTQIAS